MPFQFEHLLIPELVVIDACAWVDHRGLFKETYKRSEFAAAGLAVPFVQDNVSRSVQGVLRGLHYQLAPKAQAKLVTVIRGEIFDVAVDLRRSARTYGKWAAITLSDRDHRMLFVPAGFAHGFCVLSAEADVLYKVTNEYDPTLERGVRWDDPEIGIRWPISEPVLSDKDRLLPKLQEVRTFPDGGAS